MRVLFTLAIVCMFFLPLQAGAQSVRISLDPLIESGLDLPVFLTNAHDGTNRRFIIEQLGRISVLQPGSSSRATFIDISGRVLCCGEQGLLGLAFHPQYASNRKFYVDYTRQTDGATVIAEYQTTANPNLAAASSERILLVIPQPFENHNGGMLAFGPDGYLYIGMGDGGAANDPGGRAQNKDELLGKILRIDVDKTPYASPATNPFAGALPGRDEIFALGMRNPWRFSFDRATGQLYVGDVGQGVREEVDLVTNGGNYGWRVIEGTLCTNLGPASCATPGFISPIAEYDHFTNGRCSVTGGYVYRGSQQSLPYGAYIYGDYCSGEIFMLQGGIQSVLLSTPLNISSFGEDESGELYVMGLAGSISHIVNPDMVTDSTRWFGIGDRGSFSTTSAGAVNQTLGYARVQACCGNALPGGMAIFGYRASGVLVSEASVPVMPLMQVGRISAEVGGVVNTGIAIANPSSEAVTVSFYFTDTGGTNVRQGSTTIGAGRQIAAFLNEAPFNGGPSVHGSFTFTSSALVSAIALQGYTNERAEFLMTSLPIADLSTPPSGVQTISQFAEGGGWRTDLVLVNPTDIPMNGSIVSQGPAGQSVTLGIGVSYSVPARSATRLQSSGSGGSLQVGSIQLMPSANSPAPSVSGILSNRSSGVTLTQAAVPAISSDTAFRMFIENLGTSIETGVAIANTGSSAATVSLEVFALDGTPTALTGSLSIPANGQAALFLNQIPGFTTLPPRFQGVLRATSATPFAMTGLRCRYNERGEFLITTTLPVPESYAPASSELIIPHFALGGGYEMQFALFSGRAQEASGTVYFFDQNGNPVTLPFR